MFTGLIEEIAVVRQIVKGHNSARIDLQAVSIMPDMQLGDSISVNGVCLTVTNIGANWFSLDVVPETMRRTNLNRLQTGSKVNVERAMKAGGRFGGHIVSGHIDGVGSLKDKTKDDIAVVLTIAAAQNILRYVVEKGSICVDGVSLTVMDVNHNAFSVSIIPHTGINTALLHSKIGDELNLECDVIAKYVEKLVFGGDMPKSSEQQSGLTIDHLREHGFA